MRRIQARLKHNNTRHLAVDISPLPEEGMLMPRSVTFAIETDVHSQISICESAYGTLTFCVQVLGAGCIRDLRALFFDLKGLLVDDGLSIYSAIDETDLAFDGAGVDSLGRRGCIKDTVSYGADVFDVCIEFENSAIAVTNVQSTRFILSHDTLVLSLDMIDLNNFAVCYVPAGKTRRTRNSWLKDESECGGVADGLGLIGVGIDPAEIIPKKTNGIAASVSFVFDSEGAFSAVPGGFERRLVKDGHILGTIHVNSAGTATFTADGPGMKKLAENETVNLDLIYETTSPGGSLITSNITLIITGAGRHSLGAGVPVQKIDPGLRLDLPMPTGDMGAGAAAAKTNCNLIGKPSAGKARFNYGFLTRAPGQGTRPEDIGRPE